MGWIGCVVLVDVHGNELCCGWLQCSVKRSNFVVCIVGKMTQGEGWCESVVASVILIKLVDF